MDKNPFSEEYRVFLELLKELRTQAGVTQTDIAAALHESQSFISKCERGERRLDVIELRQLCGAIGVSLTAFATQLEQRLLNLEGNHE